MYGAVKQNGKSTTKKSLSHEKRIGRIGINRCLHK